MGNLNVRQPKTNNQPVNLSDGCKLASIGDLQLKMGITRLRVRLLLRHLRIPLISIGDTEWFNLLALDKAIYYLSRVGGPGLVGPGSNDSDKGHRKSTPRKLSDADMEVINSDSFTFQWLMLRDFTVFTRPQSLRTAMSNIRANRKTTNDHATG